MRKITGSITCQPGSAIPSESLAIIQVIDASLMDAPSKTLGEQIINNPETFPLNFQVEYHDEPLISIPRGRYSISIRITKHDKLIFCNDTNFSVVDFETGKIRDHLDVHVVKVEN
jgi:putative lipoprotein